MYSVRVGLDTVGVILVELPTIRFAAVHIFAEIGNYNEF